MTFIFSTRSRAAEVRTTFMLALLLTNVVVAAEQVEVIAESAVVKVGDRTIATIRKGERYPLVKARGVWLSISLGGDKAPSYGWILEKKVRRLAAADSDGPPAAELAPVRVGVDFTQMTAWTRRPYLCFHISLTNQSGEPLRLQTSELLLQIDRQRLSSCTPDDDRPQVQFEPTIRVSRMLIAREPRILGWLHDVEITPDGEAAGWLCFDLTTVEAGMLTPLELSQADWRLTGKVGRHVVDFDLKANEQRALAAHLRASQFEPSVHVIEARSRLNLLNIGTFAELSGSLPEDEAGCLVTLSDGTCLLDFEAVLEWFRWEYRRTPEHWLPIVFGSNAAEFQYRVPPVPAASSEAAGTVAILGRRAGSSPKLIGYLAHEDAGVRVAAARALGAHLADADVMDALIRACDAAEPTLRAAAVAALGSRVAGLPASARLSDSTDTAAILKAMHDPEAGVRLSAASAAIEFADDATEAALLALLALLDDEDVEVRAEACRVLAARKTQAAVPALRKLQAGRNRQLKAAAIDALARLGELTPVAAALAKISSNIASEEDFSVVANAKPPEAIAILIRALRDANSGLAAKTLGELGSPEAVQPIIDEVYQRPNVSGAHVEALGKLGDQRAIGPIRTALRLQDPTRASRAVCFVALARLNQPDAADQTTAFFGQALDPHDRQSAIATLGESKLSDFVPLLECQLDDDATCRAAAMALRDNGSPEALEAIANRLKNADYRHGAAVLNGLAKDTDWLGSADARALVGQAGSSLNAETQTTARKLMEVIDR